MTNGTFTMRARVLASNVFPVLDQIQFKVLKEDNNNDKNQAAWQWHLRKRMVSIDCT